MEKLFIVTLVIFSKYMMKFFEGVENRMKENYEILEKIIPLLMINSPDKLKEAEEYLLMNSNLPGPRANLTLAYEFAEFFDREQISNELIELLFCWANIPAFESPVNDPREYLPFCAVMALSSHYFYADEKQKGNIMNQIKAAMNDSRWRIRESAAMALQLIAEKNFEPVKEYIMKWYPGSNYLEKRAFLAALAHPPILKDKEIVRFSLSMSENILKELVTVKEEIRRSEEVGVLIKGLEYCLSVFVTELPEEGFELLKKFAGSDNKIMIKILKSNLGKSRLIKKYPELVREVQAVMS